MRDTSYLIREIRPDDNEAIAEIIKTIFIEFELPLTGSTFEDKEIPIMYESYQGDDEFYLVVEVDGMVLGGAGVKPLAEYEGAVCELQKMYFKPEIRGLGIGKILLEKCLDQASELGYERCYLESASQLEAAIYLYEKNGFIRLDNPMGNTGHYACGVWMIKDL